MESDSRLNHLIAWVDTPLNQQRHLAGLPTEMALTPVPLTGDAGFRRYFRVTQNQHSWILVDAPLATENTLGFVEIAKSLVSRGLNVPIVLAENLEHGFMLLSDLGEQLYSTALENADSARVAQLYGDALGALGQIQQCQATEAYPLPVFDREMLLREMNLLPDWLIENQLGINLEPGERKLFSDTFELLADNALQQPQVFVHRDYHCRNLMVCESGHPEAGSSTDSDISSDTNPGIIDFQDAVIGPVTYDLVSLLKDCYIKWPDQWIETQALSFLLDQQKQGNLLGCSNEQFLSWFDLMGIQRHLKAAGIFARLNQRDNKPGYLNDIPRTLSYIVETGLRYPEIKPLAQWLEQRVMPTLAHKLPV